MNYARNEPIRTALFVPGDRPERYAKAVASGAELVIIDLEDAVRASQKEYARGAVMESLASGALTAAVRINPLADGGRTDLEMLAQLSPSESRRLRAVVLPKAESADDLSEIAEAIHGLSIFPLIETAAGLAASDDLARSPHAERLAFGALDFGADVNATGATILDFARCQIVLSSRVAGLGAPLDSPNPEFRDAGVVREGASAARALGYGGQLCIHPRQVQIVAKAFRPTSSEADWARQVLAAGDLDGVTQLGGAMVDRPVALRAAAILRELGD